MQQQQMDNLRQQQKENIMKRAAADDPSIGLANLRAAEPPPQRTPEFYDMGEDPGFMSSEEEAVEQHTRGVSTN